MHMISIGLFMKIVFLLANYILHNVDIFFCSEQKGKRLVKKKQLTFVKMTFNSLRTTILVSKLYRTSATKHL